MAGQRQALVTGATGFIGRHVCRQLSEAGWPVVGVATRPRENAPMEHLVEYRALRLPSAEFAALVEERRPTLCVHCAGRASVDLSLSDPAADFDAAVNLTHGVLEALRTGAPECRLVYVSSAAVYGQPDRLPIGEDQPLAPISPYGFHRVLGEQLCREYAAVYGLRTTTARVFSAYGPGLRRQLLWDLCRRALTEPKLVLRGTGRESRDFVHGRDVAGALLRIADAAPGEGEAINVATGDEVTIRQVAELALAALGIDGEPEFDGQVHAGNPTNWRADVTRLRELGFTPEVAFPAGVEGYAAWCRAEIRGW